MFARTMHWSTPFLSPKKTSTISSLSRNCYDLITQVATLDLRLEDKLGVRGRECTID